jgi:hypothetical protein
VKTSQAEAQMASRVNSTKHLFKEELVPNLDKLFQKKKKIEQEEKFPYSFCEVLPQHQRTRKPQINIFN